MNRDTAGNDIISPEARMRSFNMQVCSLVIKNYYILISLTESSC